MGLNDGPDLTPEQIRAHVTWLQQQRSEGADRLHARAAFMEPVTLTDAESAARARAKLEGRTKP